MRESYLKILRKFEKLFENLHKYKQVLRKFVCDRGNIDRKKKYLIQKGGSCNFLYQLRSKQLLV